VSNKEACNNPGLYTVKGQNKLRNKNVHVKEFGKQRLCKLGHYTLFAEMYNSFA